jgi:NAD(P)-dependent dehydrogenase (short-subunit alcohol dehydrogenase family)
LGSGFTAESTAADVIRGIDLTGKVAIVTGGYSGLGVETVRALASAGAEVIVPARDHDKAVTALEGIDGVEIEEVDLLDPASIDAFAKRFPATGRLLHIWGHRNSNVHFDDPNFQHRDYEPLSAYGQSKTANILFAVGLDKRGQTQGVRAYSLHPDSAVTNLARYASGEQLKAIGVLDANGKSIIDPARNLKTVEQGAATSVWCATSPQLDDIGGVYCENSDIAPLCQKRSRPSATILRSAALAHERLASCRMP